MTSRGEIARRVEHRAAGRCEYCLMHQSLQGATFHVEHVLPRRLGGSSDLENLAWACPSCNLHKADRIEAHPSTGQEAVALFHPRRGQWHAHFRWDGFRISGITLIGQATVEALQLNHPRRIKIRQAEALFDLFPPSDHS